MSRIACSDNFSPYTFARSASTIRRAANGQTARSPSGAEEIHAASERLASSRGKQPVSRHVEGRDDGAIVVRDLDARLRLPPFGAADGRRAGDEKHRLLVRVDAEALEAKTSTS